MFPIYECFESTHGSFLIQREDILRLDWLCHVVFVRLQDNNLVRILKKNELKEFAFASYHSQIWRMKKKIKDGRIKLLYHIKTWLPIRQIIHSLWQTWTIQSLNFSTEHMEHAFSHSICLTFATISMTLARIWTAFSGTRTDLFWLIKPLVTLEKGSGRSLNSIISSRYTSTCTSKINLYHINCMYQFLPYHEFQRIRKWNTGNRLLYYLPQCPWYICSWYTVLITINKFLA